MFHLPRGRARLPSLVSGVLGLIAILLANLAPDAVAAADAPFNTKDPVFGAACPTCVWGGLGEFVRQAMAADGKAMRICYNCNLFLSPLIVAEHRKPPS